MAGVDKQTRLIIVPKIQAFLLICMEVCIDKAQVITEELLVCYAGFAVVCGDLAP